MADELQHLIERVRSEAIEKAESEAERIVSGAKEKAAARVKEAEEKAKELIRKAEADSELFVERSRRTLEQAARDLLISVGQGVENILSDLVDQEVDEALDENLLQQLLVKVVDAYLENEGRESRIELWVSEKDREAIVRFFSARYHEKMAESIEIHDTRGILKGFRVSVKGKSVQHDFTREAMAEALAHFLRPHLSEIVHKAARNVADNGNNDTDEQPRD